MSEVTVRGLVKAMQTEIRETSELQPTRASEICNQLTALMGNVLDEQRVADCDYNVVLLRCLEGEEAANRAKIRAETSPEYARKREAADTYRLVIELIRSLRGFLRAQAEELRLSR